MPPLFFGHSGTGCDTQCPVGSRVLHVAKIKLGTVYPTCPGYEELAFLQRVKSRVPPGGSTVILMLITVVGNEVRVSFLIPAS